MEANTPTKQQPEMIFTMGLPASGKSYIANEMYPAAFYIDPDLVKESHKDYDPNQPHLLHDWSKDVTELMFQETLTAPKNLQTVVDGTGTNQEKMIRKMGEAKRAGFKVKILYVRTSLETALERNQQRDRTVDTAIIHRKYQEITESWGRLSQSPLVDHAEIVNND